MDMLIKDRKVTFQGTVLLAAVLVYGITAWSSSGYHSADEHFQIIAFAQAELGELPVEHLPWEYEAGIRSSLQPWVAVAVFKLAAVLGITDPFNRTLLLRLLTAVLALIAIRVFVQTTIKDVPPELHRAYLLLSYFLWFLPFLYVRFGSEGWSAIFLMFGLGQISGDRRNTLGLLWAGAAFGIAVLCRPPVGLIVLSTLAWMVIARRAEWRNTTLIMVGSAAMAALGFLMDSAFHGHPHLSTLHYLTMGFGGDPDVRFDTLPWYYYPPWIVKYAIPPIGIALLVSFALVLWKRPDHPLVWCILPFLAVHSFIPHKELRFLYPLAPLAPITLILGLAELRLLVGHKKTELIGKLIVVSLVLSNIMGTAVVMTSAAGVGRTAIAKALFNDGPAEGAMIAYVIDPERAWRISLPDFYLPEGMRDTAFLASSSTWSGRNISYLVAHDEDLGTLFSNTDRSAVHLATTEAPWVAELMRWYTWGEGPAPWSLYRIGPSGQ